MASPLDAYRALTDAALAVALERAWRTRDTLARFLIVTEMQRRARR
jgi:hypothetical protein